MTDLGDGLKRIAKRTDAFLAVSNGPNDIIYLDNGTLRVAPVFQITPVDTLGAGDAFHGGFVLALAEGQSVTDAMRFGAAVAGHQMHADRRFRRGPQPGRGRGAVGGTADSAQSRQNGTLALGRRLRGDRGCPNLARLI